MFKFLKKSVKTLLKPQGEEIRVYKDACDELVTKYETLLKQISEYMQENQIPLRSFEKSGQLPTENVSDLQLNTFSLLAIKDKLITITDECDDLLHHGSTELSDMSPYKDTVQALLSQLRELRKYSEQIEGALGEFEDKLLKMEEVLAEKSLWN